MYSSDECVMWNGAGNKSCHICIDWFWLWGWLINKGATKINKGAICTRTAPLFWNFISLFQGPQTRLVRKIGSQNQSIVLSIPKQDHPKKNLCDVGPPPHCFSMNPQHAYLVRMRTAPPPPLPPPSPLNYPPHCRCICPPRPPQPLCGHSLDYAYINVPVCIHVLHIHFPIYFDVPCLLESGPCPKINKHREISDIVMQTDRKAVGGPGHCQKKQVNRGVLLSRPKAHSPLPCY